MTFIAAVTSPRFVFLSSDLRVTTIRGRNVTDQSDGTIKATLLDSDELFGFTGFARIGGKPTDEWLGSTLIGVAPADRLEAQAAGATRSFRKLKLLEPQAFLGVGFHNRGKKRVPHAWLVTNSWNDDDFRYDPRHLDNKFHVHRLPLGGERPASLITVGGEDDDGEVTHAGIHQARVDVEILIRRDAANPRPIMDRLAQLNSEMTSLGAHIGATSVVTSLPRNARRDTGIVMWLEPPGPSSMSRSPVSANYVSDFRGLHPHYWRQPGLISANGFSVLDAISTNQTSEIKPDPRRGPTGASFGL